MLDSISIEAESNKNGPFQIELKFIEFAWHHKADEFFEKYNLPIFLRV